MSDQEGKGLCTYPSNANDPDQLDVLRNKFAIGCLSALRELGYRLTHARQMENQAVKGPAGKFDKAHLKAIHRHIFQDVYEWVGRTRNETPVVDGRRVEPVRREAVRAKIEAMLAEGKDPWSEPLKFL
jgi:cell filamentation protein